MKTSSQAHRASTSGENGICRFPQEKLTIPVDDDLTFGFKTDPMQCKICFQIISRCYFSFYIEIGSAPEMLCFLHSGAQGWLFVIHQSLSSTKLCDVCGVSWFIHSSSVLVSDFKSIFINHRFSTGK